MRRRELIVLLGCAVVVWPIAATRAQQKAMLVIGVLDVADAAPFLKVFRDALRALGYVDGENIRLEVRSAEGNPQRISKLAEELVRLRVDVIVARLNLATSAAKAATSTIPIVMAPGGAPIETGLMRVSRIPVAT